MTSGGKRVNATSQKLLVGLYTGRERRKTCVRRRQDDEPLGVAIISVTIIITITTAAVIIIITIVIIIILILLIISINTNINTKWK